MTSTVSRFLRYEAGHKVDCSIFLCYISVKFYVLLKSTKKLSSSIFMSHSAVPQGPAIFRYLPTTPTGCRLKMKERLGCGPDSCIYALLAPPQVRKKVFFTSHRIMS